MIGRMPPAIEQRPTDIAIRSEVSQLGLLRETLERLGHELAVPDERLAELLVAVDELLSNVIKYAWSDQPEADRAKHRIAIRIVPGREQIEIEVTDDGRAFDPRAAAQARPAGRRPRPGGVGLQMLKKLVDEIYYERSDGLNRTRLIKRYAQLGSRRGQG